MASEAFRQLLAVTLASSAVIALVMLVRRPVRHAFGAAVAYRLWWLVPIALVAMLLPGAPRASSELVFMQLDPVYSLVQRSLSVPLDTGTSINWYAWLLGAWGVGAALCLAWFLGLQRAYLRGLGELSEDNGTLRAESSAGCPALLGVRRPRIVLPNDFERRYTAQEQALVLAHETVHLERRDTLWNALVVLIRCAFWFNPLVHVAAGFMRADQELACDAAVIDRHPTSRRSYAEAMLKTELADAALPVGCHWHSSQAFKERLEMLKTPLPGPARRAIGGGLFAITSIAVAFAAWATEPATSSTTPQTADAPVAAPGAPHKAMLRKGVLRFPPEGQIQVSSATATQGPNGEMILEGDVLIQVIAPPGPRHTVKMIKTPDGEVTTQNVVEDAATHTLTVRAQKVIVTTAADGSRTLEFEDGTVDSN